VQAPSAQVPLGQILPHTPQFSGSVFKSVHELTMFFSQHISTTVPAQFSDALQ
jgi:hypothetical protein